MKLTTSVEKDSVLDAACRAFDYSFSGTSETDLPDVLFPPRDGNFSIGLIVGASGSGKSHYLRAAYGEPSTPVWAQNKAIISHFPDHLALSAVGLNSIPSWCRPYHVLSTGEKFRADLARGLVSNATFDEFTSVVDRTVAAATARSLDRYVRKTGLTGLVFASCHRDIIPWLQPDWVFDTDLGSFLPRGSLQRRPEIQLDVFRCHRSLWKTFSRHHYMSASLMRSARCYAAFWEKDLVGFASAVTMPCGTAKNAWREHRTVILPDFQGLGAGVRLSDAVAAQFVSEGKRYFSKTAHPRMGGYRDASPLWRPTSKNHVIRKDVNCNLRWEHRTGVFLWSHEFIGN